MSRFISDDTPNVCKTCGLTKPSSEFGKAPAATTAGNVFIYVARHCRECARAAHKTRMADAAYRENRAKLRKRNYAKKRQVELENPSAVRTSAPICPYCNKRPCQFRTGRNNWAKCCGRCRHTVTGLTGPKAHPCPGCGKLVNASHKYCSNTCYHADKRVWSAEGRACAKCGVFKPLEGFYKGFRGGAPHCYCKECLKARLRGLRKTPEQLERKRQLGRLAYQRSPEKAYRSSAVRRARIANSPVIERVSRKAIIERDKSTCYLCNRVLEDSKIVLEHVIPLCRGGEHSYKNLRVACRPCNVLKGRHLLEELEGVDFTLSSSPGG